MGVPQIVPLELPNDRPPGSKGEISHELGVEPDVWPANACIPVPLTRVRSLVGKLSVSPVPTTHIETVVLADPPVLLAQTVYVVLALISSGVPWILPVLVLKLSPMGRSVELIANDATTPPPKAGLMSVTPSLGRM